MSPVFISPMVPINDIFRSSLVDLLLTSAERNGVKRERAYSLLTVLIGAPQDMTGGHGFPTCSSIDARFKKLIRVFNNYSSSPNGL